MKRRGFRPPSFCMEVLQQMSANKTDYIKVAFKGESGWALVHKSDVELLAKYPVYKEPVAVIAKAEKAVSKNVTVSGGRDRKPS